MSSDWIRRLDEGLDEEPPDDSLRETATDPSSVPDWGARGFFIQMLHEQYHVEIEGIWNKEHAFYIVVPSLDAETKALDGQPLQEWFKHHRPAACPVYLSDEPPEGSTRVRVPSIEDETTSFSSQLPHDQFICDLNLRIPIGVPAVGMRRVKNALQLITERELTSRERAQVTGALSQVARFNLDLEFTVEQPNRGKGSRFSFLRWSRGTCTKSCEVYITTPPRYPMATWVFSTKHSRDSCRNHGSQARY